MSWMKERICPVCKAEVFDPDCDEVDIGVGVQEFNFRGICPSCGEVAQCGDCGAWMSRDRNVCRCVAGLPHCGLDGRQRGRRAAGR